MIDPFSLAISTLSLGIASVTAWLTLFRRGTIEMTQPTVIFLVRRVNLWVIDDPLLGRVHLDCVVRLARGLVGISAPCGTTNCASATRHPRNPSALRRTPARLRGLTASRVAGRSALVPSMAQSVRRCCVVSRLIVVGLRVCQEA
jgi:hypothetical protein